MNKTIDPCYCEQAKTYENMLEAVFNNRRTDALLKSEIRKVIDKYKLAQYEHAEEVVWRWEK